MRRLHLTYCFVFWVLTGLCPIQDASAQHQSADSASAPSTNALLADMARLIKEHAYFNGITMVVRYDAYADTTTGRKLYVGEQYSVLSDANPKEWYCIDFMQSIKADELKIVQGKNGGFTIDASKRITKKIKRQVRGGQQRERQRNARLFILFAKSKKKRRVDYDQLFNQLTYTISQLINDRTNYF